MRSDAVHTDQQDCSQIPTDRYELVDMAEFLASILAKIAYLAIEALVIRLIRVFMPTSASPATP